MAGIPWPSLRTLCSIFCCPPLPSRIAAKLAFVPPECSYEVTSNMGSMRMRLNGFDEELTEHELDMIEPFTTLTSRGETIACAFIRTIPHARHTILFSHGNAVDIGHMAGFLLFLADQLQCNVLTYDYAGYGISTGSPSEANIYADAEAAWQCLVRRYNVSPDKVILYGQSIGTAPTVDLAAKYEVGGVVLHSALMSGMRMAFPNTRETWFFDAFASIDKVEKIASVVLVIHGTADEVIDFSHGESIYKRCPRTVEPLWVQGAGHNDIEHRREYIERLKRFINIEMPTS